MVDAIKGLGTTGFRKIGWKWFPSFDFLSFKLRANLKVFSVGTNAFSQFVVIFEVSLLN